jgi:DNA-binding transcriptional ArsR family regulator
MGSCRVRLPWRGTGGINSDEDDRVTTPLHQLKAEFFKTLTHPIRIRVLELLSDGERSVGDLLREVEIEASNLSQQLAVLRRAGLVTTRKEGATVYYSLVSSEIADLLAVARTILTSVLSKQLSTLQADARVTRRNQVRRAAR